MKIEEYKLVELLEFIQRRPQDAYINPEVLIEKFDLDMDICLKILVVLENEGILTQVYKVYCPDCMEFSPSFFNHLNEVEDYEFCNECSKKLVEEQNPYKFVVVFFKVIS